MAAEHDIDGIVREAFFTDPRHKGVMVEVGAALPDYLSISASYRALGWKVIAIEPNPVFCEAHRQAGHEVLQYACSDEDAENIDFFVVDSGGPDYFGGQVTFESFSSLGIHGKFADLHDTVRTEVKTIPVKVRKLDSILAEHEPGLERIDLVAVDVEGWEINVMRGFDLFRYQPKVVILENLFKEAALSEFMFEQRYGLWRSIEPNEVYVPLDTLDNLPA
jgi:FkbM family methyltransferase